MTPCRWTYVAIASRSACQGSWPRRSAINSSAAHNSSETKTVRSLRSFAITADLNAEHRQEA